MSLSDNEKLDFLWKKVIYDQLKGERGPPGPQGPPGPAGPMGASGMGYSGTAGGAGSMGSIPYGGSGVTRSSNITGGGGGMMVGNNTTAASQKPVVAEDVIRLSHITAEIDREVLLAATYEIEKKILDKYKVDCVEHSKKMEASRRALDEQEEKLIQHIMDTAPEVPDTNFIAGKQFGRPRTRKITYEEARQQAYSGNYSIITTRASLDYQRDLPKPKEYYRVLRIREVVKNVRISRVRLAEDDLILLNILDDDGKST